MRAFRDKPYYRRLLAAMERRAVRQGARLVKVHPAYTSAIGALKYAHQYRLSIHRVQRWRLLAGGWG